MFLSLRFIRARNRKGTLSLDRRKWLIIFSNVFGVIISQFLKCFRKIILNHPTQLSATYAQNFVYSKSTCYLTYFRSQNKILRNTVLTIIRLFVRNSFQEFHKRGLKNQSIAFISFSNIKFCQMKFEFYSYIGFHHLNFIFFLSVLKKLISFAFITFRIKQFFPPPR